MSKFLISKIVIAALYKFTNFHFSSLVEPYPLHSNEWLAPEAEKSWNQKNWFYLQIGLWCGLAVLSYPTTTDSNKNDNDNFSRDGSVIVC